MSLLGIIETLRRNLKAVVVACWVVLALLVAADIVRIFTAEEHHEALASEASAKEAPAAKHESHAAVAAEHASPSIAASAKEGAPAEHAAVGEHAEAHGFWATAYHVAETKPVFWTLFGFLGGVVIVVVSKSYGHFGVSVKEDYYGE